MITQSSKDRLLIIVGPTAVGKTGISLRIADRLGNVEIISADSRQVYKYMDIGTAKPTKEELSGVRHYFIDIKLPDEYYSAGKFGREARIKIKEVKASGKVPIVVGGSGLYIRALVDGFFEKQIYDQAVKKKLKELITRDGVQPLYEKLQKVDPISAEKIHPNDGHRIVRALEVYELTGQPLSEFQKLNSEKASFHPVFIGLNRERKHLYQIIENRVDLMIERGLIDEVKELKKMGYDDHLNSMQTVGYREVFDFLNDKIDYHEMIRLIKQRSRNYAKRQLTWFRKDDRIHWINLDFIKNEDEVIGQISALMNNKA